jgi:hypothetical protein
MEWRKVLRGNIKQLTLNNLFFYSLLFSFSTYQRMDNSEKSLPFTKFNSTQGWKFYVRKDPWVKSLLLCSLSFYVNDPVWGSAAVLPHSRLGDRFMKEGRNQNASCMIKCTSPSSNKKYSKGLRERWYTDHRHIIFSFLFYSFVEFRRKLFWLSDVTSYRKVKIPRTRGNARKTI